ncbi:MAG: ATP-binding cassette domain-containing protein [Bacillota bacterium]|nr:ATP-binding cassette domain-containing protein [Bacillota bacterium]
MIALEGKDLAFSYIDSPVLFSNVNIQVKKGECVALTGASGSGKSTLCHILAGIIPRSIEGNVQGKVFLLGDEIQTLSLVTSVARISFQHVNSQQ